MKALVLAGGRGKRLDDLTEQSNKCMIPINGRPVIAYNLDNAVDAGVDEIVLVVGYRAEDIINHFGNRYRDRPIRYVIQWEQRGLVHAMACAAEAIGGHDFMLLLGDEVLVNPRHTEMMREFHSTEVFALCGILWVDDKELIKRTYTLVQDNDARIWRLIEKPVNPLNNLQGTGDIVFHNAILEYIERTPINYHRGERELPDLIQCAIDDGKIVKSFMICDKYTNINTKDDIALAEQYLPS